MSRRRRRCLCTTKTGHRNFCDSALDPLSSVEAIRDAFHDLVPAEKGGAAHGNQAAVGPVESGMAGRAQTRPP